MCGKTSAIAGEAFASPTTVAAINRNADFNLWHHPSQPRQPPVASLLQSSLVNYSQSIVFWTTDGYGPEKRRYDLRVNEYVQQGVLAATGLLGFGDVSIYGSFV
jgi:hypothetical protein